jgi:hypothetical protein
VQDEPYLPSESKLMFWKDDHNNNMEDETPISKSNLNNDTGTNNPKSAEVNDGNNIISKLFASAAKNQTMSSPPTVPMGIPPGGPQGVPFKPVVPINSPPNNLSAQSPPNIPSGSLSGDQLIEFWKNMNHSNPNPKPNEVNNAPLPKPQSQLPPHSPQHQSINFTLPPPMSQNPFPQKTPISQPNSAPPSSIPPLPQPSQSQQPHSPQQTFSFSEFVKNVNMHTPFPHPNPHPPTMYNSMNNPTHPPHSTQVHPPQLQGGRTPVNTQDVGNTILSLLKIQNVNPQPQKNKEDTSVNNSDNSFELPQVSLHNYARNQSIPSEPFSSQQRGPIPSLNPNPFPIPGLNLPTGGFNTQIPNNNMNDGNSLEKWFGKLPNGPAQPSVPFSSIPTMSPQEIENKLANKSN